MEVRTLDQIVDAVPLREQVANIIRKMIITGQLTAGSPISERQLSAQMGVSTTPVKEAFRVLEYEGLLYSVPRKGSYVSVLSKKNMLQIVFMRSSLEGVAAHFAAMNATKEDIKVMEKALEMSGKLIAKNELNPDVAEYNEQFHSRLRQAAGNNYLNSLLRNMKSIDDAVRKVAAVSDEVEPPRAQKEHLAILEAIKNRDGVLAEQLMVAHIRRVGEFVLENNK